MHKGLSKLLQPLVGARPISLLVHLLDLGSSFVFFIRVSVSNTGCVDSPLGSSKHHFFCVTHVIGLFPSRLFFFPSVKLSRANVAPVCLESSGHALK